MKRTFLSAADGAASGNDLALTVGAQASAANASAAAVPAPGDDDSPREQIFKVTAK
jgi:hypothetical protein